MAAVQPAGTAGADGVGCIGAGVDCERAAEGVWLEARAVAEIARLGGVALRADEGRGRYFRPFSQYLRRRRGKRLCSVRNIRGP